MRRALLVLVLGAALAGSAACSSAPELPTEVGAVVLDGDERAADPCALLDPGAFTGRPESMPSRPFGDVVGSCRADGYSDDDRRQMVAAWFEHERAASPASTGPGQQVGAVTVLSPAPAADTCRRVARLVDGTLVVFGGWSIVGSTSRVGDCAVAERALALGLRRLAADGIRYRPGWQPPYDLARADACAALAGAAPLLGLAAPPVTPGFGNWSCVVGIPGPGATHARLEFVLDDEDRRLTDREPREWVGAHPLHLQRQPDSYAGGRSTSNCGYLLEWGLASDSFPFPQDTLARVSVGSASASSCDMARVIATDLATRLPAPV